MRVLFLASRELTGPMTGRKQVLRTVLESLHRNGCEVILAAYRANPAEHLEALSSLGVTAVYPLFRPGMVTIAFNVVKRYLFQGMSGNECLFYSPQNLQQLKSLVEKERIDFVVCDMVRLAPYAAQLGKPWHLDLDDLLSQRYITLADSKQANDQLLGFYANMLPRPLRKLAGWIARTCLPLEVGVLAKREMQWSLAANSVSLVSPDEAAKLAARLNKPVQWLPMRAQFPPANFVPPPKERSIVFLGGMDYQPNLDAVRYYREAILPAWRALNLPEVPFHVIGKTPDAVRREFAGKEIIFHGYVEDLATELCKHSVFLAPITHGTGIKTKVLDALGHKLAVVTTSKGIEGIGVKHGEHCLVGDTPQELALHLQRLLADATLANELSTRGEAYVREHFSLSVIAARWREVLQRS
jgi:glycosyltransferase involved in cell wall biosynthesis